MTVKSDVPSFDVKHCVVDGQGYRDGISISLKIPDDFVQLRGAYRDWHPKSSTLRDVKRKLQPIERLLEAVTG